MIKLKYNKNLIYFLILILITKLIALFIFPREISFYITGLTKFNYFNTLSMTIDMQSFRDGTHPGTPIYLMESLFLKITGSKIDDFYNFFYFNHILIFLINIFSITNFFNYFKKTMSKFEIISFLLLFSSSFNFYFGLEIIDLMSYQFSITLLLITYFVKSIYKEKDTKLAILSSLALAIKITFLPLVCSILLSKFYFIKKEDKFFKKIVTFFSIFSFSYLIFNFPIIGRLPRIFIDAIFLRADASLDFDKIIVGIKYSLNQMVYENIILIPIVLFSLFISTLNVYLYFKKKRGYVYKHELKGFLIFSSLISLFYIYTLLVAGQAYSVNPDYSGLEKENFLRNNYPYMIFIFINFYILKFYYKINLFNKKYLIIFFILVYGFSFVNYIHEKNKIVKDKIERKQILIDQTKKYLNLKDSVIAYSTYQLGYGFGEEIFFLSGDSIEGNEYFIKQIIDKYPRFRFFRLNDIIKNIAKNENDVMVDNNITKFKKYLKKFDIVLKNNLPNEIYEALSHQSKNTMFNNNIARSKDIYSLQGNKNYPSANAILFYHPDFIHGSKAEKEIYKYIEKNTNIKKKVQFKVKNDEWHLYILD